MAGWREAYWTPSIQSGAPRRDRGSGTYQTYSPDPVSNRPIVLDQGLSELVAESERSIRALGDGPGAECLAKVARFLLRSEAIASSRIEGIAPSPQQVALAELVNESDESVRGIGEQAQLVANNITVVATATKGLVQAPLMTAEHIIDLHRALLPDDRHHGLRQVQNWIGGSAWNPLEAVFVPPQPDEAAALMTDLVEYANGAAHSAVVQAAIVHAQFETIHPFTDGNGRVGRALIHTILARRGLTSTAVLPVSLVLATLSERYVAGLASYRYTGDPTSREAKDGVDRWTTMFTEATITAAEQARSLMTQIADLHDEWRKRLADHRHRTGRRRSPRAGSTVACLLDVLPEAPVVTARTIQRILGVSAPAANAALDELESAGVVHPRRIQRGTTAYIARDILDLITDAERRLASTRFDTRISAPNRTAPRGARPRPAEVD